MTSNHKSKAGFTLGEAIVSMGIVLLVVASATSGWLHVNRGERVNSIQSELDLDVRKTMELLKRDLRLSSMDKIFFYPTGPGPYNAICFPLAKDNDGDGIIELLGGTNIIWDSTVVYHIQTTTPFRLLRTVFEPRDNTLTDAQRVAQIASTVANGHGRNTHNGNNATTMTLFENLFTWSIEGKSATFDGYSSTLQRKVASFGSILLGPGTHNVKFAVEGKNPSSSGYQIGVDTLTVSPCGVEREAEAQSVIDQSGASASPNFRTEGSWSGNYQLLFPASSIGSSFTLSMENDRWEETNFRGTGSLCTRTEVCWDTGASTNTFAVKLEGGGYAWVAANQTQSGAFDVSDNSLTSRTYRVLLRGSDMTEGSFIDFNGQTPIAYFYAPNSNGNLHIKNAFIGEAESRSNYTPNAAGTMTRLKFWGSADSYTITAGDYAYAYAYPTPFHIDKTKSYIISYDIGDTDGNAKAWTETHAGAPGSYYIMDPGSDDVKTPSWSSKTVYTDSCIVGLDSLYTFYPSNGLFNSQIFDTKLTSPAYLTMAWNAYLPSSSAIGMKIRSGNQPDLSDAPGWSNVVTMSAGGNIATLPSKRYVQFQSTLTPSPPYGGYTPSLKDVTIRWTGTTKVVDIASIMTTGPNYGICSLTIDNRPLLKGIKVNLTIFKDVVGWTPREMRLTSSMSAEIEPRNTGK